MAVMNAGRIEHVGTPAEVYEQPATSFVAGFVGVSNVLSGPAAAAITGSEHAFTIRPEKIRLARVEDEVEPRDCTATGHVREVIYLGALTRYIVDLDGGGQLVVTQQNLATSSMEALQVKGRAVRLLWDARLNRSVEEGRP
jgi:putative spermidine/putrescine transport system ATP-binding protein